MKLPVYPRVGGGTAQMTHTRFCGVGLSPRGRGNPPGSRPGFCPTGSIPAWAGEPSRLKARFLSYRVYPRVGGGTHFGPDTCPGPNGSIPAWAGEPISRSLFSK